MGGVVSLDELSALWYPKAGDIYLVILWPVSKFGKQAGSIWLRGHAPPQDK